jgi:cell division protease FtsH
MNKRFFPQRPGLRALFILILVSLLAALAIIIINPGGGDQPQEIPFSELSSKVQQGQVAKINIDNSRQSLTASAANGTSKWLSGIPGGAGADSALNRLLRQAKGQKVVVEARPLPSPEPSLLERSGRFIPTFLTLAIILLLAYYLGAFRSKFGQEAEIPDDINFSSVAGCPEAIEELREIEIFLNDPERYRRLGATPPRGVLLHGPPGTGKTLLARAMAAEAQVPFFSVSGSSFVEMFAGMGAQRVRSLFSKAEKAAPAIIFIDELDAVGMKRSAQGGDSALREGDQTLVEILRQMDGFSKSALPVIVIGATNRLEALDPALVRPGRFDRHINIDPPDRQGRLEILKVHGSNKRIDADLQALAVQTAGMTGADLALILNEAALIAARRDAEVISEKDVNDAFLRVVAGAEKQNHLLSADERQRIAIHESGHAVVREVLGGADRVHRISIIPRGRSGGQTVMVSEEDVFLYSPEDLQQRIAALLAGRAAEELFLGQVSSGSADDLQQATALAESYVLRLGMGDSLGLRVVGEHEEIPAADRQQANQEISALLDDQYQHAAQLLKQHAAWVEELSAALLQKETIERQEFLDLRPESDQHS